MDYKATLHLPRTDFPMRANLPQREPDLLARWDAADLYGQLRARGQGRPPWILHDGPPYANGHIHMGTALNKVLKDIVVKSKTMLGHDAVYRPGWDCHGLPIEHQVDKELGLDKAERDVRRAMDPAEKRRRCRAYALRFIDIQRAEFRRLGVFGDWTRPYLTMAPAYQATIVREFGRFVGRGLVYKGLKPVHWCMHCKTALAQAEVEYEEQETPSVYVKFPLVTPLPGLAEAPQPSVVIWTTTPWTLPANLAVAVNPSEKYVALDAGDETLVVAAALAEQFVRTARLGSARRLRTLEGAELAGLEYRHPWIDRSGRIAAAPFVAMDAGTGLVHIAPGHGEEDYELGRSLGLPIYNPVDDDGRFVPEVAQFAGLTVWEANPRIVALLRERGALVAEVPLTHTYPHCWRCKNPTLFRATEQWFITLDQAPRGAAAGTLRAQALAAIRTVEWIPPWGEERITNMIAHRPDWTISRQRVWGVPIVAFYCEACGTILLEEPIVEHVAARMEAGEGADEWYLRSAAELLPAGTACAQVRRPGVPEGDGHPRRVVRLGVQPRGGPRAGRPAPVAGGDVPRGLGPAPRLVPLLVARGGGHARAAALPGGAHPRVRRRRRGPQDVQVRREHRGARRRHREARGGDPPALGRRRGLHRGHPALRRDPGPARGGVPARPQHLPVPPREPGRLRPGPGRGPRCPALGARRLGDAAPAPDHRAGPAGVRGVTSFTSPSRASTTSAPSTSRRSTWTS